MPITPNEPNIIKHIAQAMTFGRHECVVEGDAVLMSAEYGELSDRIPVAMEITIKGTSVAFDLASGNVTIKMYAGANDMRVSFRDEDDCELGFMSVPAACITHTEFVTIESDGLLTKIDDWPDIIV